MLASRGAQAHEVRLTLTARRSESIRISELSSTMYQLGRPAIRDVDGGRSTCAEVVLGFHPGAPVTG